MKYTEKEYEEILKPNAKAIEEFIIKEIQPNLIEGIEIPFGDIVYRGRCGEIREKKYMLYVEKDKMFGRCGGLTIYFNIPNRLKEAYFCIDIYNDWYCGGEFIYSLCSEWKTIKSKLLEITNMQKQNRDKVLKMFEV